MCSDEYSSRLTFVSAQSKFKRAQGGIFRENVLP